MKGHWVVAMGILFATTLAGAQTSGTAESVPRAMPGIQGGAMTGARTSATTGATPSPSRFGGTGQAQGQPGIYVQLPLQAQQNTAAGKPEQDPSAYCYYADRRYSEGSRLRDQVCVRPGNSDGGYTASTELPPLKWISAAQYARGRY